MAPAGKTKAATSQQWRLRIYVAGKTPRSLVALANLKKLCERHLAGGFRIDVVDVLQHPDRAEDDRIIAVPTVVRRMPLPVRKVIGDLSNAQEVLSGLELEAGD